MTAVHENETIEKFNLNFQQLLYSYQRIVLNSYFATEPNWPTGYIVTLNLKFW